METQLGAFPMNDVEFHQLWPTNLMVRHFQEPAAFDQSLVQSAERFYDEHFNRSRGFPYRNDSASLFRQMKSPELKTLFLRIQETAYIYLSRFYPTVDLGSTELLFTSFANIQNKKSRWVNPHSHVETQFVVTYYCQVEHGLKEELEYNPGALSLHDSRSLMANWMMRQENKMFTMNLKRGTMVVFPGYVQHSTAPYFDEQSRKVAIVTNVRMRHRDDTHYGRLNTGEEIISWQVSNDAQTEGK